TVDELLTALSSTGVPIFDPRNGLYKPRIRLPAALDAIVPVAQVLALSPPDGFSSSGPPGGPFSPASKSYTLTNSGAGDLNFTVSTAAGWATVSPPSGSLAQGASTTVTVTTVQGQAYYIAVDGVAGTAGQIILNWAFGQDVVQPGDITVTPDSGFAASGPAGGPFTPSSTVYTLTNVSTGTRTWSVTGVP